MSEVPIKTGLAVRTDAEIEIVQPPSIETIIQTAVQAGRTGAELKELLDVYERVQAKRAENLFNEAFAAFQSACPAIPRSREAKIATRGGGGYRYRYASLDEIDAVAIPALAAHGFSRSFGDAEIGQDKLTVRCRLSHVGGHARESAFTVPIASSSGMSEQQKYGSAATYAKRQAFVNVAGLKVCDPDDDATSEEQQHITPEQLGRLEAKIVQVLADRVKFLAYLDIAELPELPFDRFNAAMQALEAKAQAVQE